MDGRRSKNRSKESTAKETRPNRGHQGRYPTIMMSCPAGVCRGKGVLGLVQAWLEMREPPIQKRPLFAPVRAF